MAEPSQRPRPGRSGKALLLTVLGEFALPNGGRAWTSTLIDALGLLGVGESNARQAAARLGDDGFVAGSRVGRETVWELTPLGRQLLTSGAQRIYAFGSSPKEWDRNWAIALTAIPEELRVKRHHARSQLEFAGFGFVSAGIAVSPHADRAAGAQAILAGLGLDPPALVFVARTVPGVSDTEIIGRAWDLDSLAEKYDLFIDGFSRSRPVGGAERFAALVGLVHEWRTFPFGDPEIPDELLPKRWPGPRAKALFDERRAQWSDDAQDWYRARVARG